MTMAEGSPTPRAQPFYCPYCGEQEIRPAEEQGLYHCDLCNRVWRLEYRGIGDA